MQTKKILFFFLNGLGALILEIIWVKRQLMLFGSTPGCWGSVLFVYFLGIALGSWVYSTDRIKRPLEPSGPLFMILFLLALLWSVFFQTVAGAFLSANLQPGILPWTSAMIAFLPVCFFFGSFFSLAGKTNIGAGFTNLYAFQALGSFIGIWLGSFMLPSTIGYNLTALVAILINISSLLFLRSILPPENSSIRPEPRLPDRTDKEHLKTPKERYLILAFLSGFLSLALQMLLTRFVSISTDSSLFSFGSISLLVIALLTLSSFLVSRLQEKWFKSHNPLNVILLSAVGGIALSALVFLNQTNNMAMITVTNSNGLGKAILFAAPVIFCSCLLPSLVLPFLIRSSAMKNIPAGTLISANNIGCALGAITSTFILLPGIGIWGTLSVIVFGYAGFTLFLEGFKKRIIPAIGAALLIILWNPGGRYPLSSPVTIDDKGEKNFGNIVWVKEGLYGIVTVVDFPPNNRMLWLNNNYPLESSFPGFQSTTRRMGILPVLLRPEAKNLVSIGIGTGITASGFLHSHLEHMDLVELIPEVITAATQYFGAYNRKFQMDQRIGIQAADGRQILGTAGKKYDLVVSDLFTPWNEGSAWLYTQDHFRNIYNHLSEGGLFCLWLPMFQLTEKEFLIIAKTFASVFPDTTLWQQDMSVDSTVYGLIGVKKGPSQKSCFDTDAIRHNLQTLKFDRTFGPPDIIEVHESGLFSRFVCALSQEDPLFKDLPVNTLDRPVIEFMSAGRNRILLKGMTYINLARKLYGIGPGEPGKVFTSFDTSMEVERQSGLLMNEYMILISDGQSFKAIELFQRISKTVPAMNMIQKY